MVSDSRRLRDANPFLIMGLLLGLSDDILLFLQFLQSFVNVFLTAFKFSLPDFDYVVACFHRIVFAGLNVVVVSDTLDEGFLRRPANPSKQKAEGAASLDLLSLAQTFHDSLVPIALGLLSAFDHHVLSSERVVKLSLQRAFGRRKLNKLDVLMEYDLIDLCNVLNMARLSRVTSNGDKNEDTPGGHTDRGNVDRLRIDARTNRHFGFLGRNGMPRPLKIKVSALQRELHAK